MDEVREIRNPEFGKISVLRINGYPWMVGEDVAAALGYADPEGAVMNHVEICDMWSFHDEDGEGWTVINKPAVFALAMKSNHPKAGEFIQWLIDEVWSEE
jgi:prophage antirepressor-like protein